LLSICNYCGFDWAFGSTYLVGFVKSKYTQRINKRTIETIMLILILLLVVGSALVYISKFNFMPVTVNLGLYTFSNIPLFYVIVASVIFGLVLSYLFYLVHAISNSFTLRGKNKEIKENKEEVLELTKNVHQLELENEKQKNNKNVEPQDKNAL